MNNTITPQGIAGALVTLRAPEPDDLDALYRWENDTDQWATSSTVAPMSRHQLWEYLRTYDGNIYGDRQLRLIVTLTATGEAVGAIDITDYDPADRRGWVGIYIDPAHRGHGVGLEALALLCNYAADTLGMHQLAALTVADNVVSRTLFAAAGFGSAGKLRSWIRRGRSYADALVWQRLFSV